MDNLKSILLLGLAMFFLMALSIGVQVIRTRRSPLGKVVGIFNNIKYNEKLSRDFNYSQKTRKFKAGAWKRNKDAVGFLPEELRAELSKMFEKIAEVNESIDAAARFKSGSYLAAVEADRLTAPLTSCKEKLQQWVYANMNNPEYLPKRRGLFGR